MRNAILGLLALICVAIGVSAITSHLHPGGSLGPEDQPPAQQPKLPPKIKVSAADSDAAFAQAEKSAVQIVMTIKNRGDLDIDLFPTAAPKTVSQFVSLSKKGFYNGLLFHRVIPGFVAQGGDPNSRSVSGSAIANLTDQEVAQKYGLGKNGSGHSIVFEQNKLTNQPGTLAMALSSPRTDSADSQFFINLADNTHLDGDYCVFGRVTNGMSIVNNIHQGDRITSIKVLSPATK